MINICNNFYVRFDMQIINRMPVCPINFPQELRSLYNYADL